MKRVILILSLLFYISCAGVPVKAEYNEDLIPQSLDSTVEEAPVLPSIFIWQLPDIEFSNDAEEDETSEEIQDNRESASDEPYKDLFLTEDDSVPLKGYLDYVEDSNAINLSVDSDYAINTRAPAKLKGTRFIQNDLMKYPITTFSQNVYARSGNLQYNIAPFDSSTEVKKGHFSIGTTYNESIDTSDLGFTTSFYTKYDTKYFSLSTSYDKNSGVAYSQVIDKFTLTPELKLNRYISLKNAISSDITRNRTKAELMLLIKPSKEDRVRFELGTNYTFDQNNNLIRSQVKFQTQIKL